MKTIRTFFFLLAVLFQGVSWSSINSVGTCPIESDPKTTGGDFTPFPLGSEVAMTQSFLEGIWAPVSIQCGTFFSFELKKSQTYNKVFVAVKQFDPNTCEVLAQGYGYESERVYYVSMVARSGRVYDLTIRAFRQEDLKPRTEQPPALPAPPKNSNGGDVSPRWPSGQDGSLEPLEAYLDSQARQGPTRPVVVLSLYPKRNWEKRMNYPLKKISDLNGFTCSNGDKLPQAFRP